MLACLINGKPGQSVPVSDRGLLYGDGLFETIRVSERRPVFWQSHLERLAAGCRFLGIPLVATDLLADLDTILRAGPADAILKIIMTRGGGGRGYSPPLSPTPLRILQVHELPPDYREKSSRGVRAKFCQFPVSTNPMLTGLKHLAMLDRVMASRELAPDCDEGIMLAGEGEVIEGTRSNLFASIDAKLVTPALTRAGVNGIARQFLLQRFKNRGIEVSETTIYPGQLEQASEVFFCNSVFGIWPLRELVATRQVLMEEGAFTRLARGFIADEIPAIP